MAANQCNSNLHTEQKKKIIVRLQNESGTGFLLGSLGSFNQHIQEIEDYYKT